MSKRIDKKYLYRFKVGSTKGRNGISIEFPYAATKSVALEVSEDYVMISFESKKLFDVSEKDGYLRNLIREGYKRAGFIHVLLYATMIEQKRKSLCVTDFAGSEIVNLDLSSDLILYGMIDGKIVREIPNLIKQKELVEKVYGVMKKDFGTPNAILNAYVYSKYKEMETERFMYLWMAFNGVYNLVAKQGNNDRGNMNVLLKEFDTGGEIFDRTERKKYGKKIIAVCAGMSSNFICKDLVNPQCIAYRRIIEFIRQTYKKGNTLSPYGFVMCEVAYYLRCTYFHANNAFLFMTYLDDLEFEVLTCVNAVLEEFLDRNIYRVLMEY